jgi:hypothetical protein
LVLPTSSIVHEPFWQRSTACAPETVASGITMSWPARRPIVIIGFSSENIMPAASGALVQ